MSMVFTRTRKATRLLALILKNLGLNAIPVSGQMSQVLSLRKTLKKSYIL